MKVASVLIALSLAIFGVHVVDAINSCELQKVEYPVSPIANWNLTQSIVVGKTRIIFSYKCTQGDSPNPIIPIDYGKQNTFLFLNTFYLKILI